MNIARHIWLDRPHGHTCGRTVAPRAPARNPTIGLLAAVVVVSLIFAFSAERVAESLVRALQGDPRAFAVFWIGGGLLLVMLGVRAQRERIRELVTIARQAAFAGEKLFAPAGMVVFLMGIAMMINTNWGWGTSGSSPASSATPRRSSTGIAVLSPLAKQIAASAEQNGPERPRRSR